MNMTLTFTNEQLAIIDRALGQMPYAQVAPLIADINRQITDAQAPTVEVVEVIKDEPV